MASSTGILTAGFCDLMGIKEKWYYGIFALLSTLVVYNGQRIFKSTSAFQTPWLSWVNREKKRIIIFISLSGIIAGAVLFSFLNIGVYPIGLLALVGILCLFYVVKIRGKNLRDLPGIKIHIIAFTWTAILICFPLINNQIWDDLLLYAAAHYCYILAVTIPFDIRDLKFDSPNQKTIPQVFGVIGSKVLAIALLFGFYFLMVFALPELAENPIFYLAILLQAGLILLMNEKRGDLYCAGLIDGSIALLGGSYFF